MRKTTPAHPSQPRRDKRRACHPPFSARHRPRHCRGVCRLRNRIYLLHRGRPHRRGRRLVASRHGGRECGQGGERLIPQLVWILYLTSEEDSLFYRLLTSGGNGGLSGYSRRRADSSAGFAGEPVMPRQNGTYNYNMGYAPAATDNTPVKQPSLRGNYDSGPATSVEVNHKAK